MKHTDMLTVKEIAAALNCSASYAYQLLPSIPGAWRLSNHGPWRLDRISLECWIEERKAVEAKRRNKRGIDTSPAERDPLFRPIVPLTRLTPARQYAKSKGSR